MKYDTIIIGAGSAGSILATRLSEDPNRSVLLLEAGPDYPDLESLPEEVKYGYATGTEISTSDHNWNILPEEPTTRKYQSLEGKLLADQVLLTAKYSSEEYLKTMTTGLIWAMIYGITSN